jgi:hypothetical protein
MIKVKRINAEDVAPVKFVDVIEDKRPVKGREIFPEIYSNIFFCARKKSGKTCAIAHIIDKCSTSETKVIAFVSTLHRDPTWAAIQDMCAKKKIDFTGYTSLKDESTKENILETIVQSLQAETDAKKDKKELSQHGGGLLFGDDSKPREKKSKKPKENACKIIFVLDDLSGELLDPAVGKLLKKNRHFKCKVLISSQYFNDITLQGRKQLDYVLLYRGLEQSLKKLQEIYNNLNISVPFEKFIEVYKFCTKEPFHFMYIDVENSLFRLDFTHKIELPKEDKEEEEREL